MKIIDAVEVAELDLYTSGKLLDIVKRFSKAEGDEYKDLRKQLWSSFYELELIRIELDLPMLNFKDKKLMKTYMSMIREARHWVVYGSEPLIREQT